MEKVLRQSYQSVPVAPARTPITASAAFFGLERLYPPRRAGRNRSKIGFAGPGGHPGSDLIFGTSPRPRKQSFGKLMGKVISDPSRVFDDGTKTGKNLLTDSQDCGIRLYLPVFGSRTLKMKVSPFLSPSGGDLGRQNALKPQ